MNKKLLFALLFFFLLSFGLASAGTAPRATDTQAYWALEDLTDSSGNGNSLSNNGATSGASGIINESYSFDGSNDYIRSTISSVNAETISLWFKTDSNYGTSTATHRGVMSFDSNIGGLYFGNRWSGDNEIISIETTNGEGDGWSSSAIGSSTISNGNWYHLVLKWTGNDYELWINGNNKGTPDKDNPYRDSVSTVLTLNNLSLGYVEYNPGVGYFDGVIDEVAIFDTALTSSEIGYLYASGSPDSNQQYPYGVGSNISITITDQWDSSAVNNINVTIDGTTYQNATGNVVYTDIAANASITNDILVEASDYFARTFAAETMETKTLSVYQSEITMGARSLVSNSSVTVNFTIDGQQATTYNLKAGSYTATVEPTGSYYDTSHDFNVAALDNRTEYAYVHDTVVNLSVVNARTGSLINGTKSGYVYNVANDYNVSFNFSGSNTTLQLEQGLQYEFNLDPVSGYAKNQGLDFTFTPDNSTENVDFQIYENNSIQFYFRDGSDNTLISNPVNATLSNSNQTYNFNTSSGSFFLDQIQGGTYTLISNTADFSESEILVTVFNNEYQTVNVVFGAGLQSKQFNVIDNLDDPVSGVVLTFTTNLNGSTVTVAQEITDFSGSIQVLLDDNTQYDFTAVKSGYNTFSGKVTPFQSLYTVNIESVGSRRYVSVYDDVIIAYNLTYDNSTQSAEAYFDVVSQKGSIQYWGMNTSYDGTIYTQNNSGSPSGGSVSFTINNMNLSEQSTVSIDYWFKAVNHSRVDFTESYKLLVSDTNTITTWDLSALPDGTKAFISMFVIVLFSASGLIITRRMFAGALLGFVGIMLCYAVGLLGLLFSVFSSAILIITIIADIRTGENR